MDIGLDKAIELDYNTEFAAIVVCECIAHVSCFQSRLCIYAETLFLLCCNETVNHSSMVMPTHTCIKMIDMHACISQNDALKSDVK